MPLVLYSCLASPPVRASNLLLKTLNIPYDRREVNIVKGDQFDEDFQKINPQHSIPTLQDDEFVIWDSHAINAYLVNKYAENSSLYPKNPERRALIDQRLHFDSGVLFPPFRSTTVGILDGKITSVTEELVTLFENGYEFVEKFLKDSKYAAADNITIADFSFVSSLTTMNIIVPINQEKYPLIEKYLISCKAQFPGYEEINEEGLKQYKEVLQSANFEFLEK